MLDGTACVVSDGGVPDGGGTTDGGAISCGPGTVLQGTECVPADGGSSGAEISSFTADTLWGDAPLETTFHWTIVNAPTDAVCELDTDGDGVFETTMDTCNGNGSADATISTVGATDAVLRLTSSSSGLELTETERLYANQVQWAPNVVRVAELTGLISSVASDTQVTLTFSTAGDVPTLHVDDVLFDRSAEGYVRKVVSWTTNGAQIVVQTDTATLQDVATGGFYGIRNADEGTELMGNGSECDPSHWSGNWLGGYLGIPKQEFSKDPFSLSFDQTTIGAGFWIKEATFDFNPFHFVVNIDVHTKAALCSTVTASVEGGWEPDPIEIPVPTLGQTINLGFIEAKAGLVPKLGFSIVGSLNASADILASMETSAFFTLEPDQPLTAGVTISPVASFSNPTFTAEAEAKVYFDPAVEITWGDPPKECKPNTNAGSALRIGIDPEVGLKNKLTASLDELCWEVAVYGEASAEAKISAAFALV